MSDEEIRDPSPPEQSTSSSTEQDEQSKAMTRRQFLIGSGVGLVVGAVGAAGVMSATSTSKPAEVAQQAPATKPAEAPPAQPAQAQPGPAQAPSDLPPTHRRVKLNINGKDYEVVTDVRLSLWEVMNEKLGMIGANIGCDRAQCGACAVVIDGRAVNSCTVLAARLGNGQKIITVEGLAKGTRLEDLHPIQRAYQSEGGFQCGICTRGFVMSTYALLLKTKNPSDDDIREALAGNLCRCSEYPKVFAAVAKAAKDLQG